MPRIVLFRIRGEGKQDPCRLREYQNARPDTYVPWRYICNAIRGNHCSGDGQRMMCSGLCALPQSKVGRVALHLSVELAGGVQHIVQITSRQLTVVMIFIVFSYVEVHRTFNFVGIAVVQNFFTNSICSMMCPEAWFDAWRQNIECFH